MATFSLTRNILHKQVVIHKILLKNCSLALIFAEKEEMYRDQTLAALKWRFSNYEVRCNTRATLQGACWEVSYWFGSFITPSAVGPAAVTVTNSSWTFLWFFKNPHSQIHAICVKSAKAEHKDMIHTFLDSVWHTLSENIIIFDVPELTSQKSQEKDALYNSRSCLGTITFLRFPQCRRNEMTAVMSMIYAWLENPLKRLRGLPDLHLQTLDRRAETTN